MRDGRSEVRERSKKTGHERKEGIQQIREKDLVNESVNERGKEDIN